MSSIIIDGYNLIGIHHKDLESQRQRLVERLAEYKKIKGHYITVVFDGWKSGSGEESHS
ncbi:MAG: NYN domain-containing protein, partial [Nitrospinae bacterium]|nr:NYN domain-containing protein [Nitrospinota bacterium]